MASVVVDAIDAVQRAVSPLRLRWYVFGAQAAILWGARRFSADLDVTVECDPSEVGQLLSSLASCDIALRIPVDAAFVAQTRVLPLKDNRSGLPVDVVLAGPGFEERFFARATTVVVSGIEVPLPRPEDLVVMKVLAGRPKDGEDVIDVLRCNTVDHAAVVRDLRELEALLDQSDLVPSFEAWAKRASRRVPESER